MKRVSAICLVSAALLLLTFFIFLFLAVRPDPDDMIISLDIREHSLYYALKMRYLFSSFRTTLIVPDALILGSNDTGMYPVKLFLFYLFIFLLFIFVLYALLVRVFSLTVKSWKDRIFVTSISVTLSGAAYFFCSSRIEVFGWPGASEGHLVPTVFALLALVFLLRVAVSIIDILLLTVCALIIAGGAEHINAIVILLNTWLLYLVFKKRSQVVGKKKLLFFSVFHFICFAALFSNPGVWHRVHDVAVAQATGYDPGNFFTMFFQPYKLVGVILAFFAGCAWKENFKVALSRIPTKTLVIVSVVTFLICFLMGLGAYHSYDIGRIWLPFDLCLCFCFLLFGLKMNSSSLVNVSLGVAVVFLLSAHCYRHIPALSNFRVKYDQVVNEVRNAQPGEVVIIHDFPAPDLVNLVELDPDPNHQLNVLFCRFYGSKGRISVKPSYSNSR